LPSNLNKLIFKVCNLWHNAVKGSPELQYTIELWADGMVRGPSGALTRAETLQVLYKKRRAWEDLEWTSKTVVEFEPLVFCRAYELVAGLFVQQEQGPDFLAISLARIVDEPQTARYTYSIDRNLQSFEDFAIDPTQDLIVRFYTPPGKLAYLECRTLSSQEPHPLAKTDVLAFSLDRDPIGIFSIQIADDIIGIFFLEAPFNFKLFNWRVGITIAVCPKYPSPLHFISHLPIGIEGLRGRDPAPYSRVSSAIASLLHFCSCIV
jgi:hypothetical protein